MDIARSREIPLSESDLRGQRVLVTGAAGQLGSYLVPVLNDMGATVVAFGSQPGDGIDTGVDLADRDATVGAIRAANPDIVIHAAACTDVDGIERDPARGERSNALATQNVAEGSQNVGAHLIAVSTDMVFAGDGGAPYGEEASAAPISAYGSSKLAAERAVLHCDPTFAVARTAWLYGGDGKHFPRTVLTVLRDRGSIDVVDDEFGSPTFAGDLAAALGQLAITRGGGVFHLVNDGRASRYELARHTAMLAGCDPAQVRPVSTESFLARFPLPAPRPPDSTLHNGRAAALGIRLRDWRAALEGYAPRLAAEVGRFPASAPLEGG